MTVLILMLVPSMDGQSESLLYLVFLGSHFKLVLCNCFPGQQGLDVRRIAAAWTCCCPYHVDNTLQFAESTLTKMSADDEDAVH